MQDSALQSSVLLGLARTSYTLSGAHACHVFFLFNLIGLTHASSTRIAISVEQHYATCGLTSRCELGLMLILVVIGILTSVKLMLKILLQMVFFVDTLRAQYFYL